MIKYEKVVKLLYLPMSAVLLAIKVTKLKMQAPETFEKLEGKSQNTLREEVTLEVEEDGREEEEQ